MTASRPFERITLFLLILALTNLGFVVWWWLTSDQISDEGGPIENLQLAVLFAAFLLFWHNGMVQDGAGKRAAIILSIACIYLFYRELDFRALPVNAWLVWITTGHPRTITQGIILLVLGVYAARHFRQLLSAAPLMISRHAWLYYVAVALFVTAALSEEISRADHNPFGQFALPYGQFWEEMLELNADMMLLFAALMFYELGCVICEREKFYGAVQSRT